MPRVVLMCGPAGSGKSTYARRLEQRGWARLSADVGAWRTGHREGQVPAEVSDEVEREHRRDLARLVADGRDVVVDRSFWSRAERDEYRAVVAQLGLTAEFLYLRVAPDEVRRRVAARNTLPEDPDRVRVSPETVDRHLRGFEVPGDDEPDVVVVDG